MESFTQGTMPGSGAFRCASCGHIFTLTPPLADTHSCPQCASSDVVRETLSTTTRFQRAGSGDEADAVGREAWVARARSMIEEPGEYLAFADEEEIRLVALQREWTRIGRSLAADVRFDDPTVSRRHALIVRQADGVRVLDDRSLNGVFVNGERVEWRVLEDGDEILVGRHRLTYLSATASAAFVAPTGTGEGELQRA